MATPEKDDAKNLHFLSGTGKRIVRIRRQLIAIGKQLGLMIQMSGLDGYRGAELLREANTARKAIDGLVRQLTKEIDTAHKQVRGLSREQRLKAAANIRGLIRELDTKALMPAERRAAKLTAIANDKSRGQLPDTDAATGFEVILNVAKLLLDIRKKLKEVDSLEP